MPLKTKAEQNRIIVCIFSLACIIVATNLLISKMHMLLRE